MKNSISSVLTILLFFVLCIYCVSCNNEPITPEQKTGQLEIQFTHNVEGNPIIMDSLLYSNEAGNHYMVNEIQYFISDIIIKSNHNQLVVFDKIDDIHYVDTDIESTRSLIINEEIPVGTYNLAFTFGIDDEKNNSLMFVNPPESFMFWPEKLGGGYHYLKLNGKWLNTEDQIAPFNFHLGIGQIYYSFPDSISEFVHNYFEVELNDQSFSIKNEEITTINLIMNVENWFRNPNVYDHNIWGGNIMQNQDALASIVQNGNDVFSLSTSK